MVPVIEFTTELSGDPILNIPREAAAQLPKMGRARILIVPLPADTTNAAEDISDDMLYALYADSVLNAAERRAVLIQAGLRAGWDDPEMDIYNELDPRRQP